MGFVWGIDGTDTWNEIVVVELAAIDPIDIPFAGFAPACVIPLTVTLPGTKVVPLGIGSVYITFVAAIFPILAKAIL
ncbi:hypothetical protein B4153_1614 [Bacillus cereus]|uniref:Uncharacterized protein n=1 Tax=Bacillus paranthracis TaxID=2026186 RepID=A0A7D8D2C3_9BACI|nr:hypothetical protein B4153_1614 [Bacillus cereus]CKE86014.1 Uncharacterised protein [Streptococcus pneumoniae]CKF65996.1 Uncharacterised protein [Bacillus paranthracis]KZD55320.1 hypothetical protein B4085_0923 [Bacillus cereus]KZD69411.1 hypothetical protein B4116_0387 [Bacillus cereus]